MNLRSLTVISALAMACLAGNVMAHPHGAYSRHHAPPPVRVYHVPPPPVHVVHHYAPPRHYRHHRHYRGCGHHRHDHGHSGVSFGVTSHDYWLGFHFGH